MTTGVLVRGESNNDYILKPDEKSVWITVDSLSVFIVNSKQPAMSVKTIRLDDIS